MNQTEQIIRKKNKNFRPVCRCTIQTHIKQMCAELQLIQSSAHHHFSYKPQKANAAKKSRMDQPHLEAPQLLQVRQPS